MRKHRIFLSLTMATGLLAMSGSLGAQLAGQRINPNVTIMLDTGRGMNWTKVTTNSENPSADERTRTSMSQCNQMNAQAMPAAGTTAWQMVLEAMLGDVSNAYQHCFYEEASLRPLVRIDTVTGLTNIDETDEDAVMEKVSELTTEYWQFSREPHFRLVNCIDPRDASTGGRGDWNTEYDQCIGNLPAAGNGTKITTATGRSYWCEHEVDGQTNYFLLPDGREVCLDFNPLALDRSTNGILEQYRTLARFSLMTFDNLPSPTEIESTAGWNDVERHRAGWDFGRNVPWYITAYEQRQPGNATYDDAIPESSAYRYWNAGIRGLDPEAVGRLVPISDDFEGSNEEVRHVLNTVEPLHCSFDAAMFDDAGEYLYNAPEVKPAYDDGADLFFNCRPKVAVFITDGIQTDALEFPQDYCDKAGGAPPAPYETWDPAKIYNCPFNATETEVGQLHEIVKELSSGSDAEPLYMVVIGVNMKNKDPDTGDDRCDVPTGWNGWDTSTPPGHCEPPAEDCITLEELTEAECVDTAEDDHEVFVTPRQYLNRLALKGWPEEADSSYADGTKYILPPWRVARTDGTYPWCDDDVDGNNCGGEHGDPEEMARGALFVDSAEELTEVLGLVMQAISPETVSTRTEIVTARNPAASVENTTDAAQFLFQSGYRTSADGSPWKGYLYREGQQCTFEVDDSDTDPDKDTPGGMNDDAFLAMHKELAAQAGDRRLWVLDPAAEFDDFQYTADSYKEGLTGLLKEFDDSNVLTDADLGITEGDAANDDRYVAAVTKYLYGTDVNTTRYSAPLGDIYNSTPFVLSAPTERVPYASYQEFRTSTKFGLFGQDISATGATEPMGTRKPLLYVGTNDGILHSFNILTEDGLPAEGWGYIPSPLLENIGRQFPVTVTRKYTFDDNDTPESSDDVWISEYDIVAGFDSGADGDTGYQHIFGVDAPPVAADVLLYKSKDGDDGTEKDYWRSMVVGGLGKGGYGYYALDVTRGPEHEPVYRWQLSHNNFAMNVEVHPDGLEDTASLVDQELIDAEARNSSRQTFLKMGMGLTRPELAYVYIEDVPPTGDGSVAVEHQVAVAILPGGYKTSEDGGIGISTGVYIVRLADGKLLRFLDPSNPDDGYPDDPMFESPLFTGANNDEKIAKAMTAQLVGQPIVPNGIKTGKVADEAYIGDDRGRLWRIDMSSTNPEDWRLNVFFDTLLAEHFPYKDCLSNTGTFTPGTECCTAKVGDVSKSCSYDDRIGIYDARTLATSGIDQCTGMSCKNSDYPFPRIPMLAPPTIVQDEERNNVLIFGTGQIDGLETLDHHRIFSVTVTPEIEVDLDNGGTAGDTSDDVTSSSMTRSAPTINWWLGEPVPKNDYPLDIIGTTGLGRIQTEMYPASGQDETGAAFVGSVPDGGVLPYFGLGEKLLGRVFVFNKAAYFTTFTPIDGTTQDACGAGGSKLWGVHYTDIENTVDDLDNDAASFDQLQIAEDDYVDYKDYPGEVFTGLRIVRQPSCGGVDGFTLMVQKANPAAPAQDPPTPTSADAAIITQSFNLQTPPGGFVRVGIDSWSIVMGGQ